MTGDTEKICPKVFRPFPTFDTLGHFQERFLHEVIGQLFLSVATGKIPGQISRGIPEELFKIGRLFDDYQGVMGVVRLRKRPVFNL